jgi:hypothetical protein
MKRREALVTIAALAASPAFGEPRYFNEDELGLLARLVDIIIPRTDTPGAADAGVHLYIDHLARMRPALGAMLKEQLTVVRTETFVSSPLFPVIKDLTIDGYYSTQEGLVTELGWHGNTYLEKFEGCTHPEHQVNEHAD